MQYPQLSFTSGALDPALHARVDSKLYAAGLKTCENACILPQGGVWNRPGTKYIGDLTQATYETTAVQIPFVFSVDQSYILVFTQNRMYVIKDGGLVQSAGVDYYLATGITAANLANIRYAQIADELYITSNAFTPKRITRVADDNWTIANVTFGETAYTNLYADAGWAQGDYTVTSDTDALAASAYAYVIKDGVEQAFTVSSGAVSPMTISLPWDFGDTDVIGIWWCGYPDTGGVGPSAWQLSPYHSGRGYNVYYMPKFSPRTGGTTPNKLYRYQYATSSTDSVLDELFNASVEGGDYQWQWKDVDSLGYDTIYLSIPTGSTPSSDTTIDSIICGYDNTTYRLYMSISNSQPAGLVYEGNLPLVEFTSLPVPQFGIQPYNDDLPIVVATSTTWPLAVCFHLQRCWYGGATATPNQVNASRIGNLDGFGYHTPIRDDDAIEATIGSTDVQTIQHLVPRDDNILAFTDGDMQLIYAAGGVMTPTTISFQKQFKTTVANVQPLFIGERLIYCDRLGRVLEVANTGSGRYEPIDRSLHAQHLLRGYTIISWCYQSSPEHTLWAVRSDGTLLSCTIVPELDIWAWSSHTIGGTGVQVVSVGSIKQGARDKVYICVKRTINSASKLYIEQLQDRYISDIDDAWFLDSGLGYTGGGISAPSGLTHLEGEAVYALADGTVLGPFTVASGAITLGATYSDVVVGLSYTTTIETLDVNAPDGGLYGVYHNVLNVRVKIRNSYDFETGPSVDNLDPCTIPSYLTNSTTMLSTGVIEIPIQGSWARNGGTMFRNTDPTPMTIDAVIPEFDTEGGYGS